MKESRHYREDRKHREAIIESIGTGQVVAKFTIDKGHKRGPEIHSITSTGIIIIQNEKTKKLITKLIARPGQIRRYFKDITPNIQQIISLAYEHKALGFNV